MARPYVIFTTALVVALLALLAPALAAENPATLTSKALKLEQAGNYAQALPFAQRALAIREQALDPEHPDIVTSLNLLASLYTALDEYAKAVPLRLRILTIREKTLWPEHPHVGTSLDQLANLYKALGEYAKAEPLLLRALTIHEDFYGPQGQEVAVALNNLAHLYRFMGEYGKAEPLFLRALAIWEKSLVPEHKEVSDSLDNLAGLYHSMGANAKAQELFLRSLAIREKVLRPEHPTLATGLNNLGLLYKTMGDAAKAESFLQRALVIWEKCCGPENLSFATGLNNLAGVFASSPDAKAKAEAEPLYLRSLAIREKVLGPLHLDVATSLNNLGNLYSSAGDQAKAKTCYLRALTIAAGYKVPHLSLILDGNISRLYAKINAPDAAIFFGKRSVNTTQSMRANFVSMDKELQKSFLAKNANNYRTLANLLTAEGRLPEAQQVLAMLKEDEYFDFVRRDAPTAAAATIASYTTAEKTIADDYDRFSGQLVALTREKEALSKKEKNLSPTEKKRYETLSKDMESARKLFDEFVLKVTDELEKAGRGKDVGEKKLASLEALQSILEDIGEGVVFLHYLVTEDKVWMILTTPTAQTARSAAVKSNELNRKILEFRKALESPQIDVLPQAKALYELLWRPVQEDLDQAQAKTVMVFLDGALRYIPLAALHDGRGYLAETYALPVYTAASEANLKGSLTPEWKAAGLGVTLKHGKFEPLTAVKSELASVVKTNPTDETGVLPGVVRLDAEFTEQAFSALLREGYSVVHIASHFDFNPGTVEDSALLLGDGRMLTLAKLKSGDFKFKSVDMLTLSACNTGVGGKGADGREVEGFGVLAQNRGAKAVLATLWPVADESTGLFMRELYGLRQEAKLSKAEALRQAQVKCIRGQLAGPVDPTGASVASGRSRGFSVVQAGDAKPPTTPSAAPYSHPYYWAPFIIMGNWR